MGLAESNYRKDSLRHKKSQDISRQYHKHTNGRNHRQCSISKCGCGMQGKKPIQKHIRYLNNRYSWDAHWPLTVGKEVQEPKIFKKIRNWTKKYSRTVWLEKIKRKME